MSTSSTSIQFSQDLLGNFNPRKLLLNHPEPPAIAPTQVSSYALHDKYHENAIIVLLVLICSMISCLGLFCVVKCALRCSSTSADAAESGANPLAKLANRGIQQKALKSFPTVKFTTELKLPGIDTACVICLSEFVGGEDLRILPKCNHGFHTRCIDKWLSSHSSCPTCRHCLTEKETKIDVSCNLANSQEQSLSLPVQERMHMEES